MSTAFSYHDGQLESSRLLGRLQALLDKVTYLEGAGRPKIEVLPQFSKGEMVVRTSFSQDIIGMPSPIRFNEEEMKRLADMLAQEGVPARFDAEGKTLEFRFVAEKQEHHVRNLQALMAAELAVELVDRAGRQVESMRNPKDIEAAFELVRQDGNLRALRSAVSQTEMPKPAAVSAR